MRIEEVLALPGTKILDNTIFFGEESFLYKIYDISSVRDLPLEILLAEKELIERNSGLLRLEGVFSLAEVGKEMQKYLDKINQILGYYREEPHLRFRKDRNRAYNKSKEKRISEIEERGKPGREYHERLAHLNSLAKSVKQAIGTISQRDVSAEFTEEDKQTFQRFLCYFHTIHILGIRKLKRDFHVNYDLWYVPNGDKDIILTDESVMAAALTLASRKDYDDKKDGNVTVVSRDSDIIRMRGFFERDRVYRKRFDLPDTRSRVLIYSNFEDYGEYTFQENYGEILSPEEAIPQQEQLQKT
ncbi:hypothetical protein HYW76_00320 [Candidatus Pacearchaeota archaeon]|nr:hypothetical protein [Candidatus Pacearchaeota archaeon]